MCFYLLFDKTVFRTAMPGTQATRWFSFILSECIWNNGAPCADSNDGLCVKALLIHHNSLLVAGYKSGNMNEVCAIWCQRLIVISAEFSASFCRINEPGFQNGFWQLQLKQMIRETPVRHFTNCAYWKTWCTYVFWGVFITLLRWNKVHLFVENKYAKHLSLVWYTVNVLIYTC